MDQSKIHEVLEFLNTQSREKKEEINQLIREKYTNIKEMMSETMASGEKKAQEMVTDIDITVRENPWLSVGIAAFVGFLLGFSFESACKRTK
ncbi:MAG: DUF883 domain-containing protein [wastewater metagenome]|nr:DUF883 domain-containing protein [Candidatus Loosdrechtia aerotolerans]